MHVKLRLRLSPAIVCYLEQLVETGLYGASVDEAAERLICNEVRQLLASGALRDMLVRARARAVKT